MNNVQQRDLVEILFSHKTELKTSKNFNFKFQNINHEVLRIDTSTTYRIYKFAKFAQIIEVANVNRLKMWKIVVCTRHKYRMQPFHLVFISYKNLSLLRLAGWTFYKRTRIRGHAQTMCTAMGGGGLVKCPL